MVKVKPITNKIIHLEYDNQKEMCSTLMRFSEWLESPEFAGKIFTIGQFRKWYAETNGTYSFDTDWTGFNLTQENLAPFIRGLFDPLLPGEQTVVDMIKDRGDKYSLIATYPGSDAFEHELCHALWATDLNYWRECIGLVDTLRLREPELIQKMEELIPSLGYGPAVLNDEIHAYLSANPDWLLTKKNITVPSFVTEELNEIKKKYAPKK